VVCSYRSSSVVVPSVYLSPVCPLVTSVYCGKTADAIDMPFGVLVGWAKAQRDGGLNVAPDPSHRNGHLTVEMSSAKYRIDDAASFQITRGILAR